MLVPSHTLSGRAAGDVEGQLDAIEVLSIVDLSSAGHQPMPNEDGSVWITFNGEIYNHRALRSELEAKGHRYRSNTDTETIIPVLLPSLQTEVRVTRAEFEAMIRAPVSDTIAKSSTES